MPVWSRAAGFLVRAFPVESSWQLDRAPEHTVDMDTSDADAEYAARLQLEEVWLMFCCPPADTLS